MVFSERLKDVRVEKGCTPKELAMAADITLRAVYNYEAGIREPSFDILIKICKYLDVSADYLIGLTDSY